MLMPGVLLAVKTGEVGLTLRIRDCGIHSHPRTYRLGRWTAQ